MDLPEIEVEPEEEDASFEARIVEKPAKDEKQKAPVPEEEGVWRKEYKEKLYVSSDQGQTWHEDATPPKISEHLTANWQRGRIKIFKEGMGAILSLLSLLATIIVIYTGGLDPVRAVIASTLAGILIGLLSRIIMILSGLEQEMEKEKLAKELDTLAKKYRKLMKAYNSLHTKKAVEEALLKSENLLQAQDFSNKEEYMEWRLKALTTEILVLVSDMADKYETEIKPKLNGE